MPLKTIINLMHNTSNESKDQTVNVTPPELVEIRNLHVEILGAARNSVKKAKQIGKLLLKLKSKHERDWVRWATENLPFSLRTAYHWIGIYEHRDEPKFANVANLSQAIKLLAGPVIDVESEVSTPTPETK